MTAINLSRSGYACLLAITITTAACTQTAPVGPAASADSPSFDSTLERVCEIAAKSLGVSRSRVTAKTTLNELDTDKLDFVELVMELEDDFEIKIPDKAIEGFIGTDIFEGDLNNVTIEQLARLVDDQQRLSASP